MFNFKFDIQMFPGLPTSHAYTEAGFLTNTTQDYVNSYTGESTPFDEQHTLSGEMKVYYDTQLLESAKVEQYYAQFAKRQPLPKNHGTRVEWRKFKNFAKADELVEGVIPSGQKMAMTSLHGDIKQYGTYASVSDKLEFRAYDPIIDQATEKMGDSAAETQETLIRDALLVNTNVLYCDNIAPDGTYKSTPQGPSTMGASTTDGFALLTPDMVAKAATKLKKDRAPTINGKYVAVIHPSVAYDLRKSDAWVEAHKYSAVTEIFNGEIGELHGVRFIEDTFAPVLGGDYSNKSGGVTYATYFFGKESFGIIDPEGGALEMIVHDKSEIGGPLNQFSTIGYKFETNGATILYPEYLLRVMSVSSYSATDDPNDGSDNT